MSVGSDVVTRGPWDMINDLIVRRAPWDRREIVVGGDSNIKLKQKDLEELQVLTMYLALEVQFNGILVSLLEEHLQRILVPDWLITSHMT